MNSSKTESVYSNFTLRDSQISFGLNGNRTSFLEPIVSDSDTTEHLIGRSSGIFLKENSGPGVLTWSFEDVITVNPSSDCAVGSGFSVSIENSYSGTTGSPIRPYDLGSTSFIVEKYGPNGTSRFHVSGGSSIFIPNLSREGSVGYIRLNFTRSVQNMSDSWTFDISADAGSLYVDWTPMYSEDIE